MSPAEKRVKDLIDRWLKSLDLHLQYVDLNDSAYNKVQPWPVHDRPNRLVLEHALQRALELQSMYEDRRQAGDAEFAEAFELIVALANLVGVQHVKRFIPLATEESHGKDVHSDVLPAAMKTGSFPAAPQTPAPKPSTIQNPSAPATQMAPNTSAKLPGADVGRAPTPTPAPVSGKNLDAATPANVASSRPPAQPAASSQSNNPNAHSTVPSAPPPAPTAAPPKETPAPQNAQTGRHRALSVPTLDPSADATREMPRLSRPATASTSDTGRYPAITKAATNKPSEKTVEQKSASARSHPQPTQATEKTVVEDAVRLLHWGRSWHELTELIARMADRPKLPEVRRILRTFRPAIEARVAAEKEDASAQADAKGKSKPTKK